MVAQMGTPDMRAPIAYGLSWPQRMISGAAALDFSALAAMTFEPMDTPEQQARYPGLRLAWETLAAAPGTCAVLNAANEIAVQAFLDRRIRFDQIHVVNSEALGLVSCQPPDTLEDLLEIDRASRVTALRLVDGLAR